MVGEDEGWEALTDEVWDEVSHLGVFNVGCREVIVAGETIGFVPFALLAGIGHPVPNIVPWTLALRPTRLEACRAVSELLAGIAAARQAVMTGHPWAAAEAGGLEEAKSLAVIEVVAKAQIEAWQAYHRAVAADVVRGASRTRHPPTTGE